MNNNLSFLSDVSEEAEETEKSSEEIRLSLAENYERTVSASTFDKHPVEPVIVDKFDY